MSSQDSESTFGIPKMIPYPSFTTTTADYAHDLYRGVAKDSEIEGFLGSTNLYNPKKRVWLCGNGTPTMATLVRAIDRIASCVVQRFIHPPVNSEVSREVFNAHRIQGDRVKDADGFYPELLVQASGPSFEDPIRTEEQAAQFTQLIAHSNIASFFAVRLDSEVGTAELNVKEMETHAKFIFREQPNRFFVRGLVITQKHARLLHFDRAGAQITPSFDIHQHPATLVRLIAGLASVNERALGLDDSVKWKIVDGRKAQGTLTTKAPDGTKKDYPIIGRIPVPFPGFIYQGRGTVCWHVRDPDTSEEFAVKDSWKYEELQSEHDFLRDAKDLPGVVHMVSYEIERGETKDYRCASTVEEYPNRVAERFMMKLYGKRIEFFTSVLQLLCAIRDAIAGHQHLLSERLRILHRDISHNNILLGREGAREGYRGILIDLDMAFRALYESHTINANHAIGTRIFQSLTVLATHRIGQFKIPPHDHLDEIESFFYVVVFFFLNHRPDGTRVSSKDEGPTIVDKWYNDDLGIAFTHKLVIFGNDGDGLTALEIVEKTWGPVCSDFYKKFRSWMSDARKLKNSIVERMQRFTCGYDSDEPDESDDDEDPVTLHELRLNHRDKHYSEVLSIFDEAIEALQASTTSDEAHSDPAPLEEGIDTVSRRTTEEDSVITPLSEATSSPSEETASDDEPSASLEAATSTAGPSSAPEPITPPRVPQSSLTAYRRPSRPRLKRCREDGEHSELPPKKDRRISEDAPVADRAR